jgi:hypothetical protein
MFPDNDPKNPRLGSYTNEGQWIIPASNATKNATTAANATLI